MSELRLLYADSFLVVCDKPVGVSSESPGLPDLLQGRIGSEVFPVHRLDRLTGGVCVLALSRGICSQMQSLFLGDRVLKEYLAIISGVPETDSGMFCDLLYHDTRTNKTFVVDKQRKGVKEARCEWKLERTVDSPPEGKLSLLRIRLHTGRTHQIRVQFASRKMPLVGDRRYGSRITAAAPALWAARISFPHPAVRGKTVDVASAPPDSFPWSCFL